MSDNTSLCWAEEPMTGARCLRRPHEDETHDGKTSQGNNVIWKDWDHVAFSSAKR